MMDWKETNQDGLEAAILDFKRALPGWYYSVCECQVSCDATVAPTTDSADIDLIWEPGDRFDAGFRVDLLQPATLAQALRVAMAEALEARTSRLVEA
jgi:hypothetical protein